MLEDEIEVAIKKATWNKAGAMVRFAIELIRNKPENAMTIMEALAETMEKN